MHALPSGARRLTVTQWLIVSLAAIGFAFDIYELLMMPLIIKDVITDLTGFKPGSDEFIRWASLIFYAPAFAGGIFGLLGGYLTDRLGRRRVLTWSILIYAFSAFAAGFSTVGWNSEGSHTLKMGTFCSTGRVAVAITVGVDVACFVGTGVGVIKESRSGAREAHPALKNNPAKMTNRKMRDILTNESTSAK